jgi:hypothetical protein
MPVTVELRDTSENALGEIQGLVWRYGGHVVSVEGPMVTVEAVTPAALASLFAALEADPRVLSNTERDGERRTAAVAEHQAEVEAAKRADRVAQLEAQNAEQAARIAELKPR